MDRLESQLDPLTFPLRFSFQVCDHGILRGYEVDVEQHHNMVYRELFRVGWWYWFRRRRWFV